MSRYLKFLIACTLVVIVTGAAVTSGNPRFAPLHRYAGIVLGIMLLGLLRTGVPGWIAIAVAGLEMLPASPVFHASLAPVLPAVLVLMLAIPPAAKNGGKAASGLAKLAIAIPPLVLLQIAMGAAYRHKIWGVMPHMAGALAVAFLALLLCMMLIQREAASRKLAIATMSIVLIQVSLGITAFVMRLLDVDSGLWFSVATVAHVTAGAAVLSAAVLLGWFVVSDPSSHREDAGPED